MNLGLAEQYFKNLYAHVDGYGLSAKAKAKLNLPPDKSLTYGEISFDTFPQILAAAKLKHGGTFCDLGSGTGKAVIAAALVGSFDKLIGIELLDDLYEASERVLAKFEAEVRPKLPAELKRRSVAFIHANFFDYDWHDADCVFVQATCMSDTALTQLETNLELLKLGSTVITVTVPLSSLQFKNTDSKKFQLGWGEATVFFYKKVG